MMEDYLAKLRAWASQGKRWAEALLVRAQHSSPLPPGARLAVNEEGDFAGAISMGCVESDLRENLLQVIRTGETRLVHYGSVGTAVIEVGLTCGGEIDVLLRRQEMDDVWEAVAKRDPRQPMLVLTAINGPYAGRQRVRVNRDRAVGTLGSPALDAAIDSEADALWESGGWAWLDVMGVAVFAELWEPPPPLAIIGASPIAATLCRMAAMVGFEVTVIDPRKVYASADLFPDAKQILHEWPQEGLCKAGVNGRWFVAVVAHDEKLDVPALATALRAGCRYVGLLGSRRTQAKRRAALAEQGFSEEELRKIRGPIGLPCGALEPAEIAVAILAELIAVRRSAEKRTGEATSS